MHLVYLPPPRRPRRPQKVCITNVFDFSWDDCTDTQEKFERNFEGKQRALWSMCKWWRDFPLALFTFKRTNCAVVNFTFQI